MYFSPKADGYLQVELSLFTTSSYSLQAAMSECGLLMLESEQLACVSNGIGHTNGWILMMVVF